MNYQNHFFQSSPTNFTLHFDFLFQDLFVTNVNATIEQELAWVVKDLGSKPESNKQTNKQTEPIESKKNEQDFCQIDHWATVGLSGQRSRPDRWPVTEMATVTNVNATAYFLIPEHNEDRARPNFQAGLCCKNVTGVKRGGSSAAGGGNAVHSDA